MSPMAISFVNWLRNFQTACFCVVCRLIYTGPNLKGVTIRDVSRPVSLSNLRVLPIGFGHSVFYLVVAGPPMGVAARPPAGTLHPVLHALQLPTQEWNSCNASAHR